MELKLLEFKNKKFEIIKIKILVIYLDKYMKVDLKVHC